jgi:4'-phosphopantetheinyl transferase
VPIALRTLKSKERVVALSRFSRQCLTVSSRKAGLDIQVFDKSDTGTPLPDKGIFWSVSHKPDMVAGVVSTAPVGIDVEKITDVSDVLFERIVSDEEKNCFPPDENKKKIFFRCFTGKEAVVKYQGIGLKGLSKVKINHVLDSRNLLLVCGRYEYRVESFQTGAYLSSVVKNDFNVEWAFLKPENQKEG